MTRLLKGKYFWKTLVALAFIIVVAVAINLAGIKALGGIEAWDSWRAHAYWYFLIWRLCVYAGLAYGWTWMRRRVLEREPTADARARLWRGGIAVAITLALFELAKADVF